jgi:hypothetical protein
MKLENIKNKSCKATIRLQLVQRVAYVLVIPLTRKRDKVTDFPQPGLLFMIDSTLSLDNLHLKFEYPPIMKVVFPETTKNFYISRF